MGGPSLTLTGDASPLREMTKKVRRALGKGIIRLMNISWICVIH